MPSKGYFVQYKFIIPENMKHSEYTYQKLFRAIYGYTQVVSKSNGKTYSYHRKGVLSEHPYIKQGKNCVSIPPEAFSGLKAFFQTGSNPTHKWQKKGDWKAVYYLNDKDLADELIPGAIENLLDRTFILSTAKEHQKIENELKNLAELKKSNQKIDENYRKAVVETGNKIASLPWFKQHFSKSARLTNFNNHLNELRSL